jgi:large subunit ribosomal protein L25
MNHVTLEVTKRTELGNTVRKIRRQGLVPAVLYGQEIKESIALQLPLNIFEKVYREAGRTNVLELHFSDENKKHPCLVHDLDLDPVLGTVRHIDFLEVNLKQKVEAEVPIELVGEAPAVKEFGAIINQNITSVIVEALPDKIPNAIEVDLSGMDTLESAIHVSDLKSTTDFTFITPDEETLVTLVMPRVAQEEEENPEGEIDGETSVADGETTPEAPSEENNQG